MKTIAKQTNKEPNQLVYEQTDYANLKQGGLLLQACCGPCATYPTAELIARGVQPLLYYFNPNIHPKVEWQRRYLGLQQLAEIRGLELNHATTYREADWLAQGPGDERCLFCYRVRMEAVAAEAQRLGLRYFTTTLLISPYQNREAIVAAGCAAAEQHKVQFWAADWRDHFRQGQNEARELGIYRQKYCGCIYSLQASKFLAKIQKDQADFIAPQHCPHPH